MKSTKNFTKQENDTLNAMYRYIFLAGLSFTMTKMQANGFTIIMSPAIDELYKDKPEERSAALVRHNQFYNSHAVMTAMIAGITYALEREKVEKGTITDDTIQNIKVSLMGPSAGIGDAFFFNCIRVIAAGIGIGLCAQGNILGSILFILLYAGIQLVCRWYLLRQGYAMGLEFINKLFDSGLVDVLTKAASVLGIIMIGSMVPGVYVGLNWVINISGAEVNVLEIINSILPQMLSIIAVFTMMHAIKKGVKPTTIVLWIIFGSILLAAIGIF